MLNVYSILAVLLELFICDVVVSTVLLWYSTPKKRLIRRGTSEVLPDTRPWGDVIQIFLVWSTFTGTRILCNLTPFLKHLEALTIKQQSKMDSKETAAAQIQAFIKDYSIDTYVWARLCTIDLKLLGLDGARPVASKGDSSVAVCPADCRLVCFTSVTEAKRPVSLLAFAEDRSTGGRKEYALAIARLAPTDYHRYHWPCDVTSWDIVREHQGDYHAVSNIAINNAVDVLGRNHRTVIVANTASFGVMAIVVVGACKVGSIDITSPPRQGAAKGDELGLFKYGGSTVVLVFDAARVAFDADLVESAQQGVEVLVKVGTSLAKAQ
eukprot:gene3229-7362_t